VKNAGVEELEARNLAAEDVRAKTGDSGKDGSENMAR